MPRFACPRCKATLAVAEEQRGSVVECISCGKRIRVPAAKTTAARPRAVPPPIDEVDEEPSVKKRRAATSSEREDRNDRQAPRRPSRAPVVESNAGRDQDEDRPRKKKKKKKKKKISTATSVTGGFFALLGLGLFILFLSGRWVEWLQRPIQEFLVEQGIHPILAIAVAAVVVLIPLCLLFLHLVKSAILGAMPSDIDFRPAKPSEFEDLDQDRLAELTSAYEEIGFRPLMDYTMETDIDLGSRGFARLLVHNKKRCYAEINQAFAPGQSVPMRSMVMSLLEDGWSVLITDRVASKENYLMRLPRAVWRSMPDAEPAELFDELRSLRKDMTGDLELDVLQDDTAKAYFAREKANTRARKEAVARRWALGIQIEFWLFDRNPKRKWLGKYAGKAGP